MTVVGISLVKDEADIVERTVRHMLAQVDRVIVADNGSTDGTREILAGLPVKVIDDPDPAHRQGEKLTMLARSSRGTWVVPFDADEVWYSPHGRIADVLRGAEVDIATATLFDHVAVDGEMVWRKAEPEPLLKVAARRRRNMYVHEGAHTVDYGGEYPPTAPLLEVRHFPYRSPDQFVSKVRNGFRGRSLAGFESDQSTHLREFGELLEAHGEEALRDLYFERFHRPDPENDPDLVRDPCPF